MAIGHKLYYENATGDVILITPEKHSEFAINTTKEQDFQMYDVLAARNPDTVGVIQLEYGQYAAEFQSARSVKVNPETKELLFEYPVYQPPLITQIEQLKAENENLKVINQQLQEHIQLQQEQIDALNIAMATLLGGED